MKGGFTVTCPKLAPVVTHAEALAETQKNGRNGSGRLFASAMVRTQRLAVFWLMKEDAGNNLPSVIGAA
jgi:hypothetical protein